MLTLLLIELLQYQLNFFKSTSTPCQLNANSASSGQVSQAHNHDDLESPSFQRLL
jgi:hypothetical protein